MSVGSCRPAVLSSPWSAAIRAGGRFPRASSRNCVALVFARGPRRHGAASRSQAPAIQASKPLRVTRAGRRWDLPQSTCGQHRHERGADHPEPIRNECGVGLGRERYVCPCRYANGVSEVNMVRKVTVAARVSPALAEAVQALADAGNRTVSREVAAAISEHIQRSGAPQPVPDVSPDERGGGPGGNPSSPLAGKG